MAEAGQGDAVDVAIVGAGPAGIAAACAAAEAGRRVIVLDESPHPGGQIWRHLPGQAPRRARGWLSRLERSGARVMTGATVVDVVDAGRFRLIVEMDGTPRAFHAAALVLATGARERFLPFPGWTLPGVLGIGGAQALLKSGASFEGKRVVVAGSGPLLLPVSAALARAGARLLLVAEQAPLRRIARFASSLWRQPGKLAQAASYRLAGRRAPYRTGSWITRAEGDGRVEELVVTDGVRTRTLPCDILCSGFGLVPDLELARLLGCAMDAGAVRVDRLQRTTVPNVWCAGEGTGIAGVDASLVEGSIAGSAAGGRPELAGRHLATRDRARRFAVRLQADFALREELRRLPQADTILCRCEDVRCGSVRSDWSWRQGKLYTRTGMGPCQGRVCGPAAEFLYGWKADGGRIPVSTATIDTLARMGGL